MITIYGALASPYVARCVMALRAKSLAHELQGPPGGLKSSEFMKISPFGKMPAMDDNGFTVPESEVICEYVDEKYPEIPLLPLDAETRARSRLLSRITDLYLFPALFGLAKQAGVAERDEDVVKARLAELDHALEAIEHYLEASPFAVGSGLGLADCALVPALFHLLRIVPPFGADPLEDHSKLSAYHDFIAGNQIAAGLFDEMRAAWDEITRRRTENR